jgi:hypothetical protein
MPRFLQSVDVDMEGTSCGSLLPCWEAFFICWNVCRREVSATLLLVVLVLDLVFKIVFRRRGMW